MARIRRSIGNLAAFGAQFWAASSIVVWVLALLILALWSAGRAFALPLEDRPQIGKVVRSAMNDWPQQSGVREAVRSVGILLTVAKSHKEVLGVCGVSRSAWGLVTSAHCLDPIRSQDSDNSWKKSELEWWVSYWTAENEQHVVEVDVSEVRRLKKSDIALIPLDEDELDDWPVLSESQQPRKLVPGQAVSAVMIAYHSNKKLDHFTLKAIPCVVDSARPQVFSSVEKAFEVSLGREKKQIRDYESLEYREVPLPRSFTFRESNFHVRGCREPLRNGVSGGIYVDLSDGSLLGVNSRIWEGLHKQRAFAEYANYIKLGEHRTFLTTASREEISIGVSTEVLQALAFQDWIANAWESLHSVLPQRF